LDQQSTGFIDAYRSSQNFFLGWEDCPHLMSDGRASGADSVWNSIETLGKVREFSQVCRENFVCGNFGSFE
jgi:hypothetical protein